MNMLRHIRGFLLLLAMAALGTIAPAAAQEKAPLVLAAASLQEALTEAATAYAAQGHAKPVISFAASSALARQIDGGAPADIFISADEPWMDFVANKGLIRKGTRTSFLTNRLVLVAPATQPLDLSIRAGFPLAAALGTGRLAMADPDAVPAGKYGKAALINLGVWREVEPKVVAAENVRAALLLVSRAEARAGIVYETDARVAKGVSVVGTFPAISHPSISYPIGIIASSKNPAAVTFRAFLLSSAGSAIFHKYGFGTR
jgi:molybdate transport system substrate-binding protein